MRLSKRQGLVLSSGILVAAFTLGVVFFQSRQRVAALSSAEQQALLDKYNVRAAPSPVPTTTIVSSAQPPKVPAAATPISSAAAADASASPSPPSAAGMFRLGNFQRSESRDGKKLWEVIADSGEYLPGTNRVRLQSPKLWMQRNDGTIIRMTSDNAVLTIDGPSLSAATIEGNVRVVKDDATTIVSELAEYDRAKGTVLCPGYARIEDNQVTVEGQHLFADLNKKTAEFARDVITTIKPKDQKAKG